MTDTTAPAPPDDDSRGNGEPGKSAHICAVGACGDLETVAQFFAAWCTDMSTRRGNGGPGKAPRGNGGPG